jgi:hypothetical protein
MNKKKVLPIGRDDFEKIRKDDSFFYVDKTLMIRDFLEFKDEVALITRPRRFGKTLNMTMLRYFFDITMDTKALFEGLAIMDTEYAEQINSRPVVYFSFKDCTGSTADELRTDICRELFREYERYEAIFGDSIDRTDRYVVKFYQNLDKLADETATFGNMKSYIQTLLQVIYSFYKIYPILLIDEYDQPILSSYENKYRKTMASFFSGFYGSTLKGNKYLEQALLTGIQRVAKESIFSRLNNVMVYTMQKNRYASYFGFTEQDTIALLQYYGMELNEAVKRQYDGYLVGDMGIYNPWSILNYAMDGHLQNYWVNTSTNGLIHRSLDTAGEGFRRGYEKLLQHGIAQVGITLDTSFMELENESTLWGLLVNSGYLTIVSMEYDQVATVRIPNGEVRSEFIKIVAHQAHMNPSDLTLMFQALTACDMDEFLNIYREIIVTQSSYFDSVQQENTYHMLFLGMCLSLQGMYEIESNIEHGDGRSDIRMKSLSDKRPHIIIEFKHGEELTKLKDEALRQIEDNRYYAGLQGKVLCVGIAHYKKRCEVASKMRVC